MIGMQVYKLFSWKWHISDMTSDIGRDRKQYLWPRSLRSAYAEIVSLNSIEGMDVYMLYFDCVGLNSELVPCPCASCVIRIYKFLAAIFAWWTEARAISLNTYVKTEGLLYKIDYNNRLPWDTWFTVHVNLNPFQHFKLYFYCFGLAVG